MEKSRPKGEEELVENFIIPLSRDSEGRLVTSLGRLFSKTTKSGFVYVSLV